MATIKANGHVVFSMKRTEYENNIPVYEVLKQFMSNGKILDQMIHLGERKQADQKKIWRLSGKVITWNDQNKDERIRLLKQIGYTLQ